MKPFIVYDKATGGIRRAGVCQDNTLELQADPANNEAVIEAHAPGANRIVDGAPVYIDPAPPPPPTPEEIAAKDDRQFHAELSRGLPKYLASLENRVRELEGKQSVPHDKFKTETRRIL